MVQIAPNGQGRLTGFYRGEVIQHLTHGYCKIFIPSVYPDDWKDKPEMLPPAEQASSLFAGTNNGSGEFTYPNLHSVVWCFFANEDQNYPIYFASSLGGKNAFGQYELVKKQDEDVSKRHLITSGKARVEFFESGKLSAVVESPDRRDAEVEYKNDYTMQLSDDHVTERPTQDKVDNNEISNVNCQFVMDNSHLSGTVSASTHLFDVANEASAIYIQEEDTNIVSSLNYKKTVDNKNVLDNGANKKTNISYSEESSYMQNTTNNSMQTIEQIMQLSSYNLKSKMSLDKQSEYVLDSHYQMLSNDSYTYYNNSTKESKVSTLAIVDTVHNSFTLNDDLDGGYAQTSSLSYLSASKEGTTIICSDNVDHVLTHKQNGLDVEVSYKLYKTIDPMDPTKILQKDNYIMVSSDQNEASDLSTSMKAYKVLILPGLITKYVDMTYDEHILASKQLIDKLVVDKLGMTQYSEQLNTKTGAFEVQLKALDDVSYVDVKASKLGTMTIYTTNNLKLQVGDKTSVEISQDGTITINSKNKTINLNGNTTINGNVAIKGNTKMNGTLNVTSTIKSTADVVTPVCSLNTHKHA